MGVDEAGADRFAAHVYNGIKLAVELCADGQNRVIRKSKLTVKRLSAVSVIYSAVYKFCLHKFISFIP